MEVQCPNCGAIGQITDSKIPEGGAYTRCPKCQVRLFLGDDRRSGRDRRSGKERRKASHSVVDDFPYFLKGGSERRSGAERRGNGERRANWPRLNKWSISGGRLMSRSLQI
jgi:predicted Zn finger-like uncharacterized protein